MDSLEKELTQCDIPLKPGEFLATRVGVAVVRLRSSSGC